MNCFNNECVCSVKKEGLSGYYRIHTIWNSKGFQLNITSKNGAWRGEMNEEDIKTISSQLDVEPQAYLEQCKEALTIHDGHSDMVYAVEDGSFIWKKVVDEDSGIKMKMGWVTLQPASFVDTIQDIVNAALNCNKKLQNDLNELQNEKEKNKSEIKSLLSKFDELIKQKDEMESDLYSRFILLLNAKKEKIAELQKKHSQLKNKNTPLSDFDPCERDNDSDNGTPSTSIKMTTKASHKTIAEVQNKHSQMKNKNTFQSDLDPYEMDTDSDDSKPSTSKKMTMKASHKTIFSNERTLKFIESKDENYGKVITNNSKKLKISHNYGVNNESNISSIDSKNELSLQEKSVMKSQKEIPSTKEELLDFFYGS